MADSHATKDIAGGGFGPYIEGGYVIAGLLGLVVFCTALVGITATQTISTTVGKWVLPTVYAIAAGLALFLCIGYLAMKPKNTAYIVLKNFPILIAALTFLFFVAVLAAVALGAFSPTSKKDRDSLYIVNFLGLLASGVATAGMI